MKLGLRHQCDWKELICESGNGRSLKLRSANSQGSCVTIIEAVIDVAILSGLFLCSMSLIYMLFGCGVHVRSEVVLAQSTNLVGLKKAPELERIDFANSPLLQLHNEFV
ncbi:hypothetical protein TNCV_182351 [Trichonephila clavipes]|nr:hypothetical protein TNCV_182351 [Trichonephila clavipes]